MSSRCTRSPRAPPRARRRRTRRRRGQLAGQERSGVQAAIDGKSAAVIAIAIGAGTDVASETAGVFEPLGFVLRPEVGAISHPA